MNTQWIRWTADALPSVLLLAAVMTAGGCTKEEKHEAGAGPQAAADQGQTPYYYGLIEEYQNVLAQDPHNLAAITALGNAFYDAGEWRQAIEYYQRALRLAPHDAGIITDMGTCYRNMGLPERAIREYERALRIQPSYQNALLHMGIVYGHDLKEHAKAIMYWEQLLHVAPKHPEAERLRASIAQFKHAQGKGAR